VNSCRAGGTSTLLPARHASRPVLVALEGLLVTLVPEVLFVCIHNAGRSQMAAAFLRHHGGDRVVVRSAGSAPAETINPAVAEVMAERGIDLSGQQPKKLTAENVRRSDVVITMGCGDACPVFPGTRYENWDVTDPAGLDLAAVRPVRDELERRVRRLLDDLHVTAR
jgi:arsenate reductase